MRKRLGLLGVVALPAQSFAHGIGGAEILFFAEIIVGLLLLLIFALTEKHVFRGICLGGIFLGLTILGWLIAAAMRDWIFGEATKSHSDLPLTLLIGLALSAAYTFKLKCSSWRRSEPAAEVEVKDQ